MEESTSEAHSRHKKGHMTNIYLTDSHEEAVVDFVKDHEDLYDKAMNTLRTRPGKIDCGIGLQAATTC